MFKKGMRIVHPDIRRAGLMVFTFALMVYLAACGGGGNSASSTPSPTPTPTPSSALTVSPNGATLGTGVTVQFAATNSTGVAVPVNWSVAGVTGSSSSPGTISANGVYTAPSAVISPKTVTVTAVSQASASTTATATVMITDNAAAQSGAVELGSSGGNSTDSTTGATTITCCSGTLGSLIQLGGNSFILSANHVLDKSGQGTVGQPVTQPGLVDNNCNPGTTVANLSQGAALKPANGTSGPSPSNVDAAIAQIVTGMVDPNGGILDLGAASSTSIAAAPPSSTLTVPATVLSSNEGVAKSGRSTGLTCSTLESVSTSVSVQYDSTCGGATAFTSTFSNQVIVNGTDFSASGDSGSLIVTSDTARPVGLLYAGNSTSTTANPIQDVFTAFTSGGNAPSFVPNPDHAVSCSAVQQPHSVTLNSSSVSAQEVSRTRAAGARYASGLKQNAGIRDISSGVSADNPREGAVLITVNGIRTVPQELDGVRTRVTYFNSTAPRAGVTDIHRATAIKESLAQNLMAQPGIQGVGVGISDDNPAEAALVIYVIAGVPHPEIPAVMEGLRTKIVEGDRFRAFGWGHETRPSACSPRQSMKLPKLPLLTQLP
jgi:hypothetical protein